MNASTYPDIRSVPTLIYGYNFIFFICKKWLISRLFYFKLILILSFKYYFEQKCHLILIKNIFIYFSTIFIYFLHTHTCAPWCENLVTKYLPQLKYLIFLKVEIFFLNVSFTTDQIVVKWFVLIIFFSFS